MKNPHVSVVLATGMLVTSATAATSSDQAVASVVGNLKSKDAKVCGQGIQAARSLDPSAIPTLAELLDSEETEYRRAAKRALEGMVHDAGRPGATKAAKDTEKALLMALSRSHSPQAQRELLWLLSEIGGNDSLDAIAQRLSNPELADDARMVLERIPTSKALDTLKKAYAKAAPEAQKRIAESLAKRRAPVSGFRSEKLKPTKTTSIKAPA